MSDFAPKSREIGSLLLGGGVFLVIGAVVMSLMESSYSGASLASKKNQDLEDWIERGESELSKIRVEIGIERKKLVRWEEQLADGREIRRLEGLLNLAAGENRSLVSEVAKLENEIETWEARRVSYQLRMRERLWGQMKRQKLEQKDLLIPLEFRSAIITSVDAAGLMIMHESGVSRIPAAHLSSELREKLDLNLDEAAEKISKIFSNDARLKRSREGRRPEVVETPANKAEAKFVEMDDKIRKLLSLISYADSEAANARRQDRQSTSRSAPGSLETWARRASRFEQAALENRNKLAAAILDIKKIDPGYVLPDR